MDEADQTFTVDRTPHDALDRAAAYLEGAGIVAPRLRGRLDRSGDRLAVHHGRIRTTVTATPKGGGTELQVHRTGRAPLEDTRRWLYGVGLAGFLIAWALAVYNKNAEEFLSPLVTITLFFLALVAFVVGLYFVDSSLERRSRGLILSLRDAVEGDPILVLRQEIDALERSSSIANGLLAYFIALVLEFIVYAILFSDSVTSAIDEAVALETMRFGFLMPIVPAALFGLVWFAASNKLHGDRLRHVERGFGGLRHFQD